MNWQAWLGLGAVVFAAGWIFQQYVNQRAAEKERNEAIRIEIKKAREAVDGAERAVLIASLRRGSDSSDSSE